MLPRAKEGLVASTRSDIDTVAARFVAAIGGDGSDPDLAEIFAEKVVVWHQYVDPVEVPGATMAEMMPKEGQALMRAIPDARQDDVRVLVSDGAFVMTRTTVGTIDGVSCSSPVCSVVTVDGGRITRIDAYSDREQDAVLRAALMKEFQVDLASLDSSD
jgi:ketosteroid isomerase-like protein